MKKKNLALLLALTVVTTAVPSTVFAAEATTTQTTVSTNDTTAVTTGAAVEVQPEDGVYVGDGYTLEFKVNSQYYGGFLGEFVLTNTGDKAIENWSIQCDFPEEIVTMWNGKVVSQEGTSCLIKNAEWNQDVAPGQSVSVGVGGKCGDTINLPSNLQLVLNERVVGEEEYGIGFDVLSDWQSAFTGQFKIENKTDKTIEDWELEFDFDKDIDYIWGLEIISHEGNHYVVKNSGWNQNIKAGTTTIFGFQGHEGNVTDMPTNFVLRDLTPGGAGTIITPETPEVTPETPEVTPEAPEVTPETPEVTPETPEVTPETPEVTPETPEVTPETPEVTPETPEETPEVPEETPEVPEETPEVTPSEDEDEIIEDEVEDSDFTDVYEYYGTLR